MVRHYPSLQLTLDPVATLAVAKPAPASTVAEPRRYVPVGRTLGTKFALVLLLVGSMSNIADAAEENFSTQRAEMPSAFAMSSDVRQNDFCVGFRAEIEAMQPFEPVPK